ncbi:MAG: YciI family protein [Proteobacteria bacterium]|nr:YciI family protein [Pseudomonadota bacterium]MDA0929642.1 YciI family protein [Pseudomonadota bacterium]
MQFLVTAYDGTDEQAQARRAAARPAHIEGAQSLKDNGNILIGGAILDEMGQMIGSSLIVEFEDRAALDEWLNSDPYITGDVWQDVKVLPFRVAVKS